MMNIPIELKTRIYEHIGQVRNHLGEFAADERREILESIETHIHDALESRSTGEPGMELLDAIIAEMDPPESYGSGNFSQEQIPGRLPPSQQNKSSSRRLGKGCAIVALAFIALSVVSSIFFNKKTTAGEVVSSDQTEVAKPGPSPEPAVTKEQEPAQSPVVGKWTAIDFVSSISEFNPPQTKWKGELELKGLQFFKEGTTDKPWWTWKKNRLFHSGDQSEAGLSIVTINQSEYLFIEWLSGDALINKESPKYYVLKRGAYIDPAEPKTIVEGVGWQALHIGATRAELIEEFGPPDHNSSVMAWRDKDIACQLGGGENSDLHRAIQLNFNSGFAGTTSKGIHMGSTEEEVLAAYGTPESISKSRSRIIRPPASAYNNTTMTWPKIGIQLTLNESSGVTQIDIIAPVNR